MIDIKKCMEKKKEENHILARGIFGLVWEYNGKENEREEK